MRTPKTGAEKQRAVEIGCRLKALRKGAHLSLQDIADRLNREYGASTNKGMISKYENGIHEPSAGTLFCLARILGVSSDYIMGKTEEKRLPTDLGVPVEAHAVRVFTRYNAVDGGDVDTKAYEMVPLSWHVGGREFFGFRVSGGMFAPRYYDGDVIIFERRSKTAHEQVGLVCIGDEDAFLCNITKKRDGKLIKPLERGKEAQFYTTEELAARSVQIVGAAVQVRRMEYELFEPLVTGIPPLSDMQSVE